MKYGPQMKALAAGVDVLVATPGRLIDHLGEKFGFTPDAVAEAARKQAGHG